MSTPAPLRAILMRSPSAEMAPWAQQLPQYCRRQKGVSVALQNSCLRCGEVYLRDVLVQRLGHVRLAVLVGPGEGLGQISGAEVGPRRRGEKALPDDAGRVLLLASPHLGAVIRRCGRDDERLEGEHCCAQRRQAVGNFTATELTVNMLMRN